MPLMRRRPLMRAAVVGGGAYMAGKHVARKQEAQQDQAYAQGQYDNQQQYDQQQYQQAPPQQYQQAPPAAPAPSGGGMADELAKLKSLLDSGALSPDEYEAAKQKVIQGG